PRTMTRLSWRPWLIHSVGSLPIEGGRLLAEEIMGRGVLVVFEGIDGSGKSTQRDMLGRWLAQAGVRWATLAQPSSSLAGSLLRKAIAAKRRLPPETELALFVRDRREQARSVIRPLLREGIVVVLDRHYLSSVAYQGALGLDPAAILGRCVRFSPVADVTFLFDIDPSEALRRIAKSRHADPFERRDYLVRVREMYLAWAPRVPDLQILDASEDQEMIATSIRRVVARLLEERHLMPPPGA
ncbi:MAG: dTMP kinase, partial [Candidatus Eisenbacteria bacterium]|nr:dTMP kinase [Candidatus Eisenbacteria bacterium]